MHCFKLLVCARFARTAEGGCPTHIFCNHLSCPLVVWNRIRHASGGFPSPYTFMPVGMKERRPLGKKVSIQTLHVPTPRLIFKPNEPFWKGLNAHFHPLRTWSFLCHCKWSPLPVSHNNYLTKICTGARFARPAEFFCWNVVVGCLGVKRTRHASGGFPNPNVYVSIHVHRRRFRFHEDIE